MSSVRWIQSVARLAALTAALFIGAEDADARLGDGVSFGAGESGMVVASPLMAAAAETAMATHVTMTGQMGPSPYPGGSLSGLFNRGGLLGGFAAGFLGCGVLGLLFGRGLFGELGGAASYVGLLVQLALIALLGRLIWTRWRSGDAFGAGMRSSRQLADPYLRSRDDLHGGLDPSTGVGGAADRKPEPGASRSDIAPRPGERA